RWLLDEGRAGWRGAAPARRDDSPERLPLQHQRGVARQPSRRRWLSANGRAANACTGGSVGREAGVPASRGGSPLARFLIRFLIGSRTQPGRLRDATGEPKREI